MRAFFFIHRAFFFIHTVEAWLGDALLVLPLRPHSTWNPGGELQAQT